MIEIVVGNLLLFFLKTVATESTDGFGMASMPPTTLTLQMMIDYAAEEKWNQVVFFDCIGNDDCTRPYARPLLKCFSERDIVVSIKSLTDRTDLSKVLRVKLHRVGIILLIDDIDLNFDNNLLRNVMVRHKNVRAEVLGEYASWLIVSTKWNNTQIFDAVKNWPIGIDSDVSVAMSFLSADVIHQVLRQYQNKTCQHLMRYELNYDYERLRRSQSVAPPESMFVQSAENVSRSAVTVFYTASVFKIRVDGNASLEKEDWNSWSPGKRFAVKVRDRPNQRKDLRQYIMNFGLQNSSRFYENDFEARGTNDEELTGSVETLIELINLFERCLNVSANITNYVFREMAQVSKEENNNDLVRGLTSGEIDIGAAYFEVDLDRNKLLSFSYPIVHFSRSIYFKPPEMSSNIFLQPFSPKLLLCVLATLILIVAVMEVINYVTFFIQWKEDREHFGLGEATLWCLSIMCIQGSPWTPRTRAGKTVLMVSLIFSLITYNSYSGFITSILSVKTTMINNVSDFFNYDYTFGCSKSDDNYIMMKEELRNFYVKTLESNQIKVPEKTGLEKTINGSYAFFIAETVAKRIFRKALLFKRCQISELQTNTPGTLALPISNNSPYKKIINVSILRMWQYGILRKLALKIKPPLLDCMGVLKFKQASFADVYGAFCILGAGAFLALLLFFFERAWVSRKGIQRKFGLSRVIMAQRQNMSRNDVLVAARLPMSIVGLDRDFHSIQRTSTDRLLSDDTRKSSGLRHLFPRLDRKSLNPELSEYDSSDFTNRPAYCP